MTNTVNRFAFADGLRGLAALWVVLYHLAEGHHIEHLKALMPAVSFEIIFGDGHLGVAIFFVLSGFVMAYNVRSSKADAKFSIKFILRRLIRLSPPYYFAIFFAIFFLFIKSQLTHSDLIFPSSKNVIAHLFYVQSYLEMPEINFVFWTLAVEIQFYIVFSAMLFLSDHLNTKFKAQSTRYYVSSFIAILALPWAFSLIHGSVWPGGFLAYWYCFVSGVLVSWSLVREGGYRKFVVIYIFLIGLAGVMTDNMFALVTAITAAALLFAGIYGYMNKWLNWKWLQNLGLISYSLYLLHNPITGATVNVVKRFFAQGVSSDLVSSICALILSVFVAWLAYKTVEMPSIKWSHRVVLKKNEIVM